MTDYPADSILVVLEATPTGELATSAAGLPMSAMIGAFLVSAALLVPGLNMKGFKEPDAARAFLATL